MEQAYAAIGRAVRAAQVFETILVPIFEFFKMQTEPGYLEKTGGYIPAGAFKVPVRNVIKLLGAKGQIAPDLEVTLDSYVEARHLLIHKWFQEHGWPNDNDTEGFAPVIELASRVERDATALTRLFAGYMAEFGKPEWAAATAEDYRARAAAIFHSVQKDE